MEMENDANYIANRVEQLETKMDSLSETLTEIMETLNFVVARTPAILENSGKSIHKTNHSSSMDTTYYEKKVMAVVYYINAAPLYEDS